MIDQINPTTIVVDGLELSIGSRYYSGMTKNTCILVSLISDIRTQRFTGVLRWDDDIWSNITEQHMPYKLKKLPKEDTTNAFNR